MRNFTKSAAISAFLEYFVTAKNHPPMTPDDLPFCKFPVGIGIIPILPDTAVPRSFINDHA